MSDDNKNSRDRDRASRLPAASELAAKVADGLRDVGYSETACQWIYDILTEALLAQSEYVFSELLEEIGKIYGTDGEEEQELADWEEGLDVDNLPN